MTTITIELCAEDRARLDGILEALKSHNCQGCVEAAVKYTAAQMAAPMEPVAPVSEAKENPRQSPLPSLNSLQSKRTPPLWA